MTARFVPVAFGEHGRPLPDETYYIRVEDDVTYDTGFTRSIEAELRQRAAAKPTIRVSLGQLSGMWSWECRDCGEIGLLRGNETAAWADSEGHVCRDLEASRATVGEIDRLRRLNNDLGIRVLSLDSLARRYADQISDLATELVEANDGPSVYDEIMDDVAVPEQELRAENARLRRLVEGLKAQRDMLIESEQAMADRRQR